MKHDVFVRVRLISISVYAPSRSGGCATCGDNEPCWAVLVAISQPKPQNKLRLVSSAWLFHFVQLSDVSNLGGRGT